MDDFIGGKAGDRLIANQRDILLVGYHDRIPQFLQRVLFAELEIILGEFGLGR